MSPNDSVLMEAIRERARKAKENLDRYYEVLSENRKRWDLRQFTEQERGMYLQYVRCYPNFYGYDVEALLNKLYCENMSKAEKEKKEAQALLEWAEGIIANTEQG